LQSQPISKKAEIVCSRRLGTRRKDRALSSEWSRDFNFASPSLVRGGQIHAIASRAKIGICPWGDRRLKKTSRGFLLTGGKWGTSSLALILGKKKTKQARLGGDAWASRVLQAQRRPGAGSAHGDQAERGKDFLKKQAA